MLNMLLHSKPLFFEFALSQSVDQTCSYATAAQ